MNALIDSKQGAPMVFDLQQMTPLTSARAGATKVFIELERSVQAALETYSNVHRGSGHDSLVTTHLYEQARDIVLEYLSLNKKKDTVVFCTPRRAELLKAQLKPKSYQVLSSERMGLPLGVRAVAVEQHALPGGIPFQTGGGTARLVSPGWVIWAKAPDKFEAGTPAIVNVIAFAKALRLIQYFGNDAFQEAAAEKITDAKNLAATDILYHDELEKYSRRELLNELRRTLIGRGVCVPTREGDKSFINLDNAASTPTFTPIWNAVCQVWRQPCQVQQAIIHEVKSICANVLGAPLTAYDVIFTTNTTEAINLVAENLRHEDEPGIKPVVVNTILEHNSNELPWRTSRGFSHIRLGVDAAGFVNLNELEALLCSYNQQGKHGRQRIKLVTVSGASNVLGVFNDLAEISRIVHRSGARLLVDAAQLIAHRKVEMEACGIDYLAFSAHKVYAPFGSGVLVARKELLHFSPVELELIRSSGEENVGGIAALGKALMLLQRIGFDVIQEEEQALAARALRGLQQIPGITTYGINNPDSPQFAHKGGVIVFRVEGLMANRVAQELAERGGIGVRSGCHCAHMLIKRLLNIPPLLEQFQGLLLTLFKQLSLPGLTRISLGLENSAEDVDTLIHVLGKIARQPRTGTDGPFAPAQTDIKRQMDEFARTAAQRVDTPFK